MANKKTAVQETAQAVFCAMADFAGVAKSQKLFDLKAQPTYSDFKKNWDDANKSETVSTVFKTRVESPGVSFNDVESLLTKEIDWYKSSVLIARKVIEEVSRFRELSHFSRIQPPSWSQLFYKRGDDEVADGIGKLFSIANATLKKLNTAPGAKYVPPFGNVNKWNPADIYFASEKAKHVIKDTIRENKNKPMTFAVLNGLVSDLIESGDLLPLSLKQQTDSVSIKLVNFDRNKELEEMEKYKYLGRTDNWKPYTRKSPQARYLSFRYDPMSPKSFIRVRHDPSTPAFKAEVVLAGHTVSREGSAPPPLIQWAIATADGNTNYSRKFFATEQAGEKEFDKKMKSKEMRDMEIKNRAKFEEEREWLSSDLLTNAVFPDFIKWLEKDKKSTSRFIQLLFAYTTARSELSGKFVIAK